MSEVISFGIGAPWSKKELAQARKMHAGGALSLHEIGRALNRSADAISAAVAGDKAAIGRTIHVDREYGYLVGNPRVIVDRRADGASVFVADCPWGWTRTRAEFASSSAPGIDLFVTELMTRIRLAGEREFERREKRERAREQARQQRRGR